MTSNFLQAELASLIQESKKKSPEIRAAAEKSLADLKSLSITSEAQVTGDLRRKQHFIDPFIFACKSRNARLATIGIICLQRLTAGRAVPRERLGDVLEALHETASLGLEVQLKILQTLPSLLQLYTDDLKGGLLAVALEVCDTLQASKTPVVSSTAEATFQQLVTTVYERVMDEDGLPRKDSEISVEVEHVSNRLRPAAHDAFQIFQDLCALASNEPLKFAQLKALSPQFLLEVIGSILTNYGSIFTDHPEQVEMCRSRLIPALNKLLSSKTNFAITARTLRIVYLLLREHVEEMQGEFDIALSKMIGLLEPNATQPWKRVLCMELFRGLCSDSSLLRDLFRLYDEHDDRNNIVSTLMGAFVRIASEDPTLIGLGRHSTMPSRQRDSHTDENITSFEVSDIGGAVGGVISASTTVTGLSMEWSTVRTPYLEQFDKINVSDVPTTYVYSLVLNCISAFAEGLSKFVMPLSVPGRGRGHRASTTGGEQTDMGVEEATGVRDQRRPTTPAAQKQQRLINPLTLENHPQIIPIKSCARMIETCWPALLATCSTFFNAALDSDFYHNLVRAFQKITQVSGVLELSTARDALLTSLSKAAVPSATATRIFSTSSKRADISEELESEEQSVTQTPSSVAPKQSIEFLPPRLTTRNLLCLRALLNLGIALGPTLGQDAWFIIIDAVQRAEGLMNSTRPDLSRNDSYSEETQAEPGGMRSIFGVETAAVQTASKRMFESTNVYSDEAFHVLILALFRLDPAGRQHQDDHNAINSPSNSSLNTPTRPRGHQTGRSISAMWASSEGNDEEHHFMISKLVEITRVNLQRFLSPESFQCSWDLIVRKMLQILDSEHASSTNRLQCARTVDLIVFETIKLLGRSDEVSSHGPIVRAQCFRALLVQLDTLTEQETSFQVDQSLKLEIHARLLETLENILGQCGDTLTTEWEVVLKIISSAFLLHDNPEDSECVRQSRTRSKAGSLMQKSFISIQLIISDFLSTLPPKFIDYLIRVLFLFGSQDQDLNIALTTTTFFWTVASTLLDLVEDADMIDSIVGNTWMLLFSQLAQLTLDNRAEVRQSSIKMLLRVFEASGTKLSPQNWNKCLRTLFSRNIRAMDILQPEEFEDPTQMQHSTIQTLSGAVQLAASNIDAIIEDSDFADTWSAYVDVCGKMLEQKSLAISEGVFASLAAFLKAVASSQLSASRYGTSVIQLWYSHHPADIKTPGENQLNQAALTQYALALLEILDAGGVSVSESMESPRSMMEAVYKIVLNCVHPAYTSDIQNMSPEQDAVARALPMLASNPTHNEYISFLEKIIKAPLSKAESPRKSPTFIALSRRCIELLRSTIMGPALSTHLTVLPAVLQALAGLMSTKYTTLPQGADPAFWQVATSACVDIIENTMKSGAEPSTILPTITATAFSILNPGGLLQSVDSNLAVLAKDEDFDIVTFTRVHRAVTPAMNTASSEPMKSYILVLFHASLVAQPFMFDLPKDLTNQPLKGISDIRPGTALDPVFAHRNRICYTALDALFALVARGDGDDATETKNNPLAEAAAPYVLLRCAHTFKTFIADQPLRSLTPLPQPLRVELREILRRCVGLRSADAAYGDGDGKNHLRLLNKLVVRLEGCWRGTVRKARGENWQDGREGREIEEGFERWRECLAEGWEELGEGLALGIR